MECKSIQSMASSSTRPKYDVFVSFRGEDVRNTFADHLFAAFRRNGIVAFRDDRNLMQGQHISTELVQAIEGSQVLIVIFSKNYATSSWCLQELAKMLDCSNMITEPNLLPIFYDVSPSEVRKQTGDYGKALAEHEERFKDNSKMVQQWRESLLQVSSLSGWDVQNKQESVEIEKIVKRVRSKLSCNLLSVDGLVGMQSRVEQLENLIDFNSNNDVRVVGVCGMGGIGKTTLVREVYGRNLLEFDAHCFVDDISKIFRGSGLLSLQKQFVCQITSGEIQDIFNHYEANSLIKTMLRRQKALIVLDNADEVEQLQKLGLSRDCLCPGSRVVLISRDQHVLNSFGLDEMYEVQLLNEDEAHQLFCRKAFKDNTIISCEDISREYKELTDLALKYAQGLPLAIEVLGSFLRDRDISKWRSALDRLKDNPNKEIIEVLQISFDGLESLEKELFLDIACFFNHEYRHRVEKMLHYRGFYPDIGISVLVDRSLITVEDDEIRMHDLLQELGIRIVRQSAPDEPWKWSRIWRKEDFQSIMFENTVMDNIKAVKLTGKWDEERDRDTRAEALSKMRRLKFLKIRGVIFSGSLNSISNELRYFNWHYYPFTYFPSCKLSNLFELVLKGSKIEQLWEGTMCLDNLKKLDLSESENLVKTPNLREAPNLERLILRGCRKLERLHGSTGQLTKLVELDLSECTSLMSFPVTVFGITSLRYVSLAECSRLFGGNELENGRQAHGKISASAIQCQSTIWSTFKRLNLSSPFQFFNSSKRYNDVFRLWRLSLARLSCLKELYLRDCNLDSIPEAIASLHYLHILDLRENNIVRVPHFINKLPRLGKLMLNHCKRLMYLDEFPFQAVFRDWDWTDLSMLDCPRLVERERLSGMAVSWLRKYLKEHKESTPPIEIVIPGSRIPIQSWFNHQSCYNSIRIESFLNVNDDNWIGIALCAELAHKLNPSSYSTSKRLPYLAIRLPFYHRKGEIFIGERDELVHCLFYYPRRLFTWHAEHGSLHGSHFEFRDLNVHVEVRLPMDSARWNANRR